MRGTIRFSFPKLHQKPNSTTNRVSVIERITSAAGLRREKQKNAYLFRPQELQQRGDQMPVQVFGHLARQIELGHVCE